MRFCQGAGGSDRGARPKAPGATIPVASGEHPPLRLLLGRDAVQLARQLDQADLAAIDRWEQLSTSTDFEGLTNPAESERALQALLTPRDEGGRQVSGQVNRG